MHYLTSAIIAALIIAGISLVGLIVLAIKDKLLKKILLFLVSFSAGSLMGSAFFHLLPEALEEQGCGALNTFIYLLVGFCLFFIFEKILKWHHCHDEKCSTHSFGYMNLIGDAVHNTIDGIIIVSTFMVSPALGIPVAVAIILHELPQEVGDFGVLLHAGFKKSKALIYNFITALTVVLGVIIGYFLINHIANLNQFLIPLAAGGFIYIAASDLIPELHKEKNIKKSLLSFIIFIIALLFMLGIKSLELH